MIRIGGRNLLAEAVREELAPLSLGGTSRQSGKGKVGKAVSKKATSKAAKAVSKKTSSKAAKGSDS